MSVSIKQYPQILMPVYNDIVFTVDSTNKAQCAFRYVADIYIEAVLVDRIRLFPDPVTGYASFKVNRILEDYLSYDLHANLYGASLFSSNSYTCRKFYIQFGEEYDSSAQCDAGTTVYDNLISSGNYYTLNAAFQYKSWLLWDYTNYEMTNVLSKFLTEMPNNAYISLGSQLTFNFVNSSVVSKMQVKTYDDANTLIGIYTYSNATSFSSSSNRILTVGVGCENLNNSTLLSGSQPVINAAVSYYTIQLLDSGNSPVSELKRLDIDKRINKYPVHRLWWLNRLGGFDSYDYSMKDKRNVQTQRTFYNKIYGEYRALSPLNKWTYDVGNRGKTVLSVNAAQSNTFNSNWLTEAESLWMEELFTTLEVYLSDTNVIDNFCSLSYEYNNEDLFQVVIQVSESYEIGQSVYVDFGIGNNFSYLSGNYVIDFISNGFATIILGGSCVEVGSPPNCITLGNYTLNGSIYSLNFNSELDPIIIKSTQYEELVKYRKKNIDYQLEIEPAYSINIQRN